MPVRTTLSALPVLLCCQFACADVTAVKPPKIPYRSEEYLDESKLVALKQAPALAAELDALGRGSITERVARLRKKVVADLIFVEGGTFMMGDFGPLVSPNQLHYSFNLPSRPVHEVELSSFSIAKYKTTYAEFDIFTDATNSERASTDRFGMEQRHPTIPVGVRWQRAKDYCKWLGEMTQLPFDLPTEAQWEYAARSRGQFFVWATDNGNIDHGRNVPAADHIPLLAPSENMHRYPVGLFPPNPLGLYDAAHNGEEWVNDWFDEDYYKKSPRRNPTGPSEGTLKVARGWPNGDSFVPATMYRRARPLLFEPLKIKGFEKIIPSYQSQGFRCALQQQTAVR